jgi:hypothetical protein
MEGIEIVLDDGGSRFARRRNVFVQVRTGKLTLQALDLMMASWRSWQRKIDGPIYAMFVIAADADMPTAEVRARQKEVIAEVGRGGRLRAAIVIEGQGVFAHLRRTIIELTSPGSHCYGDVEEAASALSKEKGAPSREELLAVVKAARS